MTTTLAKVRLFLLLEAALFLSASLVHAGLLIGGYEHMEARIAEGVIGLVLLIGFALLGTCVGIFTTIIGVGPQTVPDLALHVVMVALLASGLIATARWRARTLHQA